MSKLSFKLVWTVICLWTFKLTNFGQLLLNGRHSVFTNFTWFYKNGVTSQLAFIYSKLTMETRKQCVNFCSKLTIKTMFPLLNLNKQVRSRKSLWNQLEFIWFLVLVMLSKFGYQSYILKRFITFFLVRLMASSVLFKIVRT